MSVRVEFRWSEDLLARVDAARGDVPRAVWLRRAVDAELQRMRWDATALGAVERALATEPPGLEDARVSAVELPAPAEQPEMDGVPFADPSDRLRETRRVSPSGPASPRVPFRRDVKPFPRGS